MERAWLDSPRLKWRDGAPHSLQFDDVYFQPRHGPAECRHVFVQGNGLPDRWCGQPRFVIGETGFGTGLNFLVTWALWRETADAKASLDYLSVEGHPLSRVDLRRALLAWPRLGSLAGKLLAQWPPPEAGFHRLTFDRGRVRLTLLFGDVLSVLNELEGAIDAWYLDGFSPSRNPEMWSQPVCRAIARLTVPGGGFATYTVAGQVRRDLESAGFEIAKRPGFAGKREMLTGRLRGLVGGSPTAPWLSLPAAKAPDREALVIGAGLAGVWVSHALGRRGWRVRLLDRGPRVAAAASGNEVGVYMPMLGARRSPGQRWHASGFHLLRRCPHGIGGDGFWYPDGVLALAWNEAERARHRMILDRRLWSDETLRAVDADVAGRLAGVPVPYGGLYLPGAGWLRPAALCSALLADAAPRVTTHLGRHVGEVTTDGIGWRARDARGRTLGEAPVLVLATGSAGGSGLGADWLPVTPLRGQVSGFSADRVSRGLRAAVCGPGYVMPPHGGINWVGATFCRAHRETVPTDRDHGRNRAMLTAFLPALSDTVSGQPVAGRAAFRASTPDRLPLVGPIVDRAAFLAAYDDLAHGRPADRYDVPAYRTGLYACLGFGSRGLVSAPLAAELLAAQIDASPLPVERGLREALMPQRFLVRELKRGGHR